jgi:hypothetical protein
MEKQLCNRHVLFVAWHVTAKYREILRFAQQCFYSKFTSPATMQIILIGMWRKRNLQPFHILYIKAALKQKNCHLLIAFCRRTFRPPTDRNVTVGGYCFRLCDAVKHRTKSDGTDRLWSNKHYVFCVCLCILVLVIRYANRIYSAAYFIVKYGLCCFATFF